VPITWRHHRLSEHPQGQSRAPHREIAPCPHTSTTRAVVCNSLTLHTPLTLTRAKGRDRHWTNSVIGMRLSASPTHVTHPQPTHPTQAQVAAPPPQTRQKHEFALPSHTHSYTPLPPTEGHAPAQCQCIRDMSRVKARVHHMLVACQALVPRRR
jgi:hypothetical protein